MNHKIKLILISFIFIFIFSINQKVFAFSDLEPGNPNTEKIMEFYERGMAKGYPDGTFRPDATMTRAEYLTFVNRTFGFTNIPDTSLDFKDVNGDEWYIDQLKIAVDAGYIKGYPDNTFRPERTITRQEVAVSLNRLLKYPIVQFIEINDEIEIWARDSVNALLSKGIMILDNGFFYGDVSAKREATVVSLLEILHLKEANEAIDSGDLGGEAVIIPDYTNPSDEIVYALNVAVDGFDQIIAGETSYSRKLTPELMDLIYDLKYSVESYLNDFSYDYKGDSDAFKIEYNKLTEFEKTDLKNSIKASVAFEYIGILNQFFGR